MDWETEEIQTRVDLALGSDDAKITSVEFTNIKGKAADINELIKWTAVRIDADHSLSKLQVSRLPENLKKIDDNSLIMIALKSAHLKELAMVRMKFSNEKTRKAMADMTIRILRTNANLNKISMTLNLAP